MPSTKKLPYGSPGWTQPVMKMHFLSAIYEESDKKLVMKIRSISFFATV